MLALKPPATVPLADWIENSIFLPAVASALPGKMRLWAYQRGICDAIDDPNIERITVQKSARIGYTALLNGVIASYVSNQPCPILALQPTVDDARDWSLDIEAMFEASPDIRGLLKDEADETGRSTMMNRRFGGGSLKFIGAKSARNLRRHTAKVLVMDEVDGYEISQEGDPINLAVQRTLTFRDRKIISGSTPVFDFGPVTRLYEQSDKRIYEVLCHECEKFHEIIWGSIQWPEGKPEEAYWVCPGCGSVVEERFKAGMVANGRWRATAPEVLNHAGFRINALISPHFNASWGKLAAEFIQAKRNPETLQTFVNTVLGQPWKSEGDDLDEHELIGRREAFDLQNIPEEVLWLTAGVDCQDDRIEVVITGHCLDGSVLVFKHEVFWGPIDGNQIWEDLDSLLAQRFQHPNGATIGIDACTVDSGDGGHTGIVVNYTRARFGRRVVAIKGVSGFARAFLQRSSSKSPLWLVGSDAVKSQLFQRIARGNSFRFSHELSPVYFEMLTSERRVLKYIRGRPEQRFERIVGRRAETLDATCYAWAARQLIGQKVEAREAELASVTAAPRAARVIRSRWLTGE